MWQSGRAMARGFDSTGSLTCYKDTMSYRARDAVKHQSRASVFRSTRAEAEPINEQSDHTPGVVGPAIIGASAQTRDRIQKIRRGEIGADLAGRGRGCKKCLECRLESLLEVLGQWLEGRISRVQGGGQAAFGSQKGRVSLHPSGQGLARPVLGCQDRCGVRAGIDFVTEDGRDKVGALRKVAIEGPNADPGLRCDLSHWSVHPGGGEDLDGRLEQRVVSGTVFRYNWNDVPLSFKLAQQSGVDHTSIHRRRIA
jgi:hypothetical protein